MRTLRTSSAMHLILVAFLSLSPILEVSAQEEPELPMGLTDKQPTKVEPSLPPGLFHEEEADEKGGGRGGG